MDLILDVTVCPKNECKILLNLISFGPQKLGKEPMLDVMTVNLKHFSFPLNLFFLWELLLAQVG